MTDEWIAKFLRGLTIGALIGAVIAGSRVWTRWRPGVPARVATRLRGVQTRRTEFTEPSVAVSTTIVPSPPDAASPPSIER
jgi:hypothetical protein